MRALRESGGDVITAHLDRLVTLVRLMSVMQQHAPMRQRLLLLLLVSEALLVVMRTETTTGARSGDVDVQLVTLGQELSTIRVVPRASQTAAPAAQYLHAHSRRMAVTRFNSM